MLCLISAGFLLTQAAHHQREFSTPATPRPTSLAATPNPTSTFVRTHTMPLWELDRRETFRAGFGWECSGSKNGLLKARPGSVEGLGLKPQFSQLLVRGSPELIANFCRSHHTGVFEIAKKMEGRGQSHIMSGAAFLPPPQGTRPVTAMGTYRKHTISEILCGVNPVVGLPMLVACFTPLHVTTPPPSHSASRHLSSRNNQTLMPTLQ